MEIAAYPVPYIAPTVPQVADVRPSNGPKSDLPSRQNNSNSPGERILQGEVLGNSRRKARADSTSERSVFEQRASRDRPDLSTLSLDAQLAIQSYLDNDETSSQFVNTNSLIDFYV